VVDDIQSTTVKYTIECHGRNSMPCDFSHSTVVSTHWIRSCLEVCFCELDLLSPFMRFKVAGYLPALIFKIL
jgi:hypothetical protein